MKTIIQALILTGIILYVVSPVDMMPGPIDDIILIMLGLIYNDRRLE